MDTTLIKALESSIEAFSNFLKKENHGIDLVLEDASVEDENNRIYARFIMRMT